MAQIHLKMSPERITLMADSIQRDIAGGAPEDKVIELSEILAWLRYRVSRKPGSHIHPAQG